MSRDTRFQKMSPAHATYDRRAGAVTMNERMQAMYECPSEALVHLCIRDRRVPEAAEDRPRPSMAALASDWSGRTPPDPPAQDKFLPIP